MLALGYGPAAVMRRASGGGAPGPVIPEFGVSSNGSGSNHFSRTTSLPNKAPLTIRGRVRQTGDRNNYSGFAALNKTGDELLYCGTGFDGTTLMVYNGSSGGGVERNTKRRQLASCGVHLRRHHG